MKCIKFEVSNEIQIIGARILYKILALIAAAFIFFYKFTDCRVGISESAGEINEVFLNLSYSYCAAVFFYWVADRIPYYYKREKMRKRLENKYLRIIEDIRRSKEIVSPFILGKCQELSKKEFVTKFANADLNEKCYFSDSTKIIEHLEFLKKDIDFCIEYLLTCSEFLTLKQYSLLLQILDFTYLKERIIPKNYELEEGYQSAWEDNQEIMAKSLYDLYEKVRSFKW